MDVVIVSMDQARSVTKPFLKWAGGKRQILSEIHGLLPDEFGHYFEPFVGGGALFFSLTSDGRLGNATLSDANHDLISCYTAVRDEPDAVISALHGSANTPEFFSEIRTCYNRRIGTGAQRAAWFIYLNRTCHSGLYRVNKSGHFNVPFGRYPNPKVCNAELLRACSVALHGVTLRHSSYAYVEHCAHPGDLVYFDPPYDGTFAGYTAHPFGEAEQRDLARLFRRLASWGVHCVLSNSDTALTRELYSEFRTLSVTRSGAMNVDPSKRDRVREILVSSV